MSTFTSSRAGRPADRRSGRRVRTTVALGLGVCLALTAACGDSGTETGAEGDGTGKIVFWDNNGGARTAVWKKIIAAFEKENPDIDVEYVGVPITDVQSKYDTAIQGGGDSLPDVGTIATSWLANLVAQNALDPVSGRLADSPLQGKLVKGMVDSVREAGGEKELFTVPTSANQGVIWYRTDLFEAAGLEPPTSWDNFYTAADELTDRKNNKFGFTIRGGAGSVAQALEVMYGQSGIQSFWEGEKTTVNDPENVKALERYVGLFKKATPAADLSNDYTKMVATFGGGNVGMMQHNLGSYQDHIKAFGKQNVDGLPLPPHNEDGERATVSNPVDGLGLFTSGENKSAAWKFIEFAASAGMNSLWNESAGAIPAHTGAADDEWLQEAEPTRAAMESLDSPKSKVVQLPYYLPDWNNISKAATEPNFQKLLLGKMTAQEFADDLAERLNEAQAEWSERNQ